MATLAVTLEEIRALEEALHRPEVRRARASVEALLAEDFVEFGSSGTVYQRAEIIDLLSEEGAGHDDLYADGYVLTPIATGAVLLTYRTARMVEGEAPRYVLRSSIWKLTELGWQMAFHQGTPASR